MEQFINILLKNPHPLTSKNETCNLCGEFKECSVGCHSWPKLNSIKSICSSCKQEEHTRSKELLDNLIMSHKIN